jgi:hypothetical protein
VVSDSARHSVDAIFVRAARANLAMGGGDSIEIEPLPRAGGELPEQNMFVLTISSFLFRLVTVFHIDQVGAVADYFRKSASADRFDEVFGEIGNMCCGAMNRELGRHFDHLGMSTPHMLDGRSAAYLGELRPDHVSRHRITINGQLGMHATLCLCAYAPLDFRAEAPAETSDHGAIEFF